VTDLLLAQPRPHVLEPSPPRRPAPRRKHWFAIVAGVAVIAACLGYLLTDATQANDRYDRALGTLGTTRATTRVVALDLAKARFDLRLVTQQAGNDTTALSQDTSQLQGAQSALSAAQAHVAQQASLLTALHTCLGGVEQALNALAVGSQGKAAASLYAVSASCSTAVNASG
jgi:hypothetical protein